MSFQGDSIFWVEVDKVVPNPFQPRREFDEERLRELADSIRMYGVLQPLTVTRREVDNDDGSFRTEYELIAGERRWRASKLAGLAQVPVIIRSGEQTEQEKLELAIIENLQREDLNAVDRALAFKQLAEVFKLSHVQVAKKVGRSREYVSNSIRLLALPEHMLDGLRRGDISEGHARTLLMLKDRPEEQDVLYREILLKKLSVREVERISRKIATDKVRKHDRNTDSHLIEIEKEFTDTLGTRVQILKTDFGGKLTIDYFSDDDLDTLLAAMKKQNAHINAAAMKAAESIAETAVGETVIREMDSTSQTPLEKLSAATPLTPVNEEGSTNQIEKTTTPTEEDEPEPKIGEQPAEPEIEVATEAASEKEIPLNRAEEVVEEASLSAANTEVKEEEIKKKNEPESNSDLRARLEAELARLEAEDNKKQAISALETKPKTGESPNEDNESLGVAAKEEVSVDKKQEADDDLYSIRNFSL